MNIMDYVGPAIAAIAFIFIMSRLQRSVCLQLNAILVIGASGVYMSGGFGVWELAYALLAGPVLGYWALRSFYAIGVGWLMHAAWDLLHHLYGNPIWPFMPSSSAGCLIFDTLIGAWFLCGAPALGAVRGTAATSVAR